MAEILYLVDASTFIHRSYHAIRGLATADGRSTNAVYGFLATLNKLLRDKEPRRLVVAYDSKGPGFRKQLYEDYKANRPPMPDDLIEQQQPIRDVVAALGLKSIEVEGFEADDLVAALAAKARQKGWDVVIVSNDKDYYQLLSEHVSMYDPNPKKESSMSLETLRETYSLTPGQFLDAQGLMGDSTDNIPGVPGVGEKTAVKLINQFGGLEAVFENLDKIKQPKLRQSLEENRDKAFLSRDLARLRAEAEIDLSIDDLEVAPPDRDRLVEIYRDLEFTSLLAGDEREKTVDYDDYHLVSTPEELAALAKELESAERLSVDLETTSIDPMRAEIVGMSLCAVPHRAFYLPVGHKTLSGPQLDWKLVAETLGPLLESANLPKIGQNIKYDYIVLRNAGLTLCPIAGDPMVASYLIEPGTGGHNLDRLCKIYLGHTTIKYEEVTGGKNKPFEAISPEAAKDYACEDADTALILADLLGEKLGVLDLLELYETLELPLIEVLAEMEMVGVGIDKKQLDDLSDELAVKMDRSEERIYSLAGEKFNINSPKQLGEILFEKLNMPMGKKTAKKTGYSTDVEVLTDLAKDFELPAEILNYRTLAKLRSTYTEALVQLIHPKTGRVHTSFNQAVAATGRLSSSDPNLQNIPIRTEEGRRIRQAFVPGPGWKILSADYSQIELRVLAHVSQDPMLREAFLKGEDVHTRTAAEVFDVMPGMVNRDMRREAKAINFGIVYGLQAFGLSRQLGIDRKQAQKYIDQYFVRYAGVKRYIDETLETAKKAGYVTTLLGRRRNLPDLNSRAYQARSMAERMAINTPIQGSAADLIKKAMIVLHRKLKDSDLGAKMILQVHDELVFEVPEEEIDRTASLVKTEMENVIRLDVPLVVDVAYGANWAEAH